MLRTTPFKVESEPGFTHPEPVILRKLTPIALAGCFILAVGCGPQSGSANPGANRSADGGRKANGDGQPIPTQAQPRLQTLKLWLGSQELVAEIAGTPEQWAAGMMYRTNLLDHEAMLFVFPQATRASFWMRNTPLPLSCAYIDPSGTILEIHDLKPLDETPVPAATDNIQFVLETTRGWFSKNNIGTNVVLRTERGGLRETFFGRP